MSDTPRTDNAERHFGEMPGVMRQLERELTRCREENDKLRAELAALKGDKERWNYVQDNCLTVECYDSPTPGGDDGQEMWRVVEYHISKPRERYIGYGQTPRAAIDAARQPKDQ